MFNRINRRQVMSALAATGAAISAPKASARTTVQAERSNPVFAHGVASGDPRPDSIVIWTRVTTDQPQAPVHWVLARDEAFTDIVSEGETQAHADADHTVKLVIETLEPGTQYFFRFRALETTSPIGRTRTLPAGHVDHLGLALASCSNYPFGFFNAYGAIARDEAVQFVVHTGDYIYEYGPDGFGGEAGQVLNRNHTPAHETVTLADYRERHAQYKSDAGSLAMHAAHPLILTWDDHESTNNPWMHGAQNHQPETEGDWAERRAASLQAYYEWMPVREPERGRTRADFWRTYTFGDLATMVTLETRHTARGEQVSYGDHYEQIQSWDDRDRFMTEVLGDPTREMLSEPMKAELRSSFGQSVETGQPWRIVITASPIARVLMPDLDEAGVSLENGPSGEGPDKGPNMYWTGQWHLPWYTDTWDGYGGARESFYADMSEIGANDLLFLTGDSHSFFANQLFDGSGQRMGLEVGTAGISSPGDFVHMGWPDDVAMQLDEALAEQSQEVVWTDNMHQGYVRVQLGREQGSVDFVAVDTVLQPSELTEVVRDFTIVKDANGALVYQSE